MKIAAIVGGITVVCLFTSSGCDIQNTQFDGRVYQRNGQRPREARKPPCGPKPAMGKETPPMNPQCVIIRRSLSDEGHGTTTDLFQEHHSLTDWRQP